MDATLELMFGKYSSLSLRCTVPERNENTQEQQGVLYCNCVEPKKFLMCAKNPSLVTRDGSRKSIKLVDCEKEGEKTTIKYTLTNI